MDSTPLEPPSRDDEAAHAGGGPAPAGRPVLGWAERHLPLPHAEDVAGRPVLGRLFEACLVVETAAAEDLWPLSEDELGVVLRLLARLGSARERCEVAVVGEADRRGTATARGLSPVDWVVSQTSGRVSPGRAGQLLRVARAARIVGMESFLEAVASGALCLEKADQVARFERDVRAVAEREEVLADVEILVAGARDDAQGRGLGSGELAKAITVAGQYLKPARELENRERAARAGRALYRREGPAGMTTYRVIMDPEGAAIIDAAVSAWSHPVREADGSPDPRSAPTRRADALLQVLQRGIAADSDTPRGEKAQVVVTIDYEQLEEAVRGAGLTDGGQVLSPATVRRLACEAGIIPMVLGGDSAPLDVGRSDRYFRGPLRRAIVRRDQNCTWSGCTIPAAWCHVHHNVWWSRGGQTRFEDGALLCQRHHTLVHERDLTASITTTSVTWPT